MDKTNSKYAGVVTKCAENAHCGLTATEPDEVAAFTAAKKASGPRLTVGLGGKDKVRLAVNHPDQANGTVALIRAIGTDLDFYDGLIG